MSGLSGRAPAHDTVPAAGPRSPGSTAAGRRSRERILRASLDLIRETGVQQVRLAQIARRAGMSSGQVMYYFTSKESILLETLAWVERKETAQRRIELPAAAAGWPRLELFVRFYLPWSLIDPVWVLWMEAWARAPHTEEAGRFLDALMSPWREDLSEIVAQGISSGAFEPGRHVEDFPLRFCAVLDGLAVLYLRQMPDLLSGRLIELAMISARTELEPRSGASGRT